VTINAPTEMDAFQRRRLMRYLRFAPWLAALAYLLLTLGYSFMIPAWEANDELDHVANIQYEVEHFGSFVPIAYGQWHETHQPPLYYWIGAAWQRMLGVPAFSISFPPWRAAKPENDKLVFAHNRFTTTQQKQAHDLHRIRLLAPVLGTVTVAICYLLCRRLGLGSLFASSASFLVAFHPKFLILSAVITNDTLAILLGTAFLLVVVCFVSNRNRDWQSCIALSLGIGLLAGAGVLTKLNLLPLLGLLIPAALFLADYRWPQKAASLAIIILATLLVCGTWLVHNRTEYGDWLAVHASSDWLAARLPKTLKPASIWDVSRFLEFVPATLFRTFWYNGSFNQLVAPFAYYGVLWFLAAICLGQAFRSQWIDRSAAPDKRLILIWIAAFAGLLAVLLIARQTTQAEGRIAFISLSAFAILLTSGCQSYFANTRLASLGLLLWPMTIVLFDFYIFSRFVLPHWQPS
jgi:hypothetical protein